MLHKYTQINIQSAGVTLIRLLLVCSTRWRKPNLLWSSTILESEQEYRHKRLYSVNSDSEFCSSELVFCFAFACPAISCPAHWSVNFMSCIFSARNVAIDYFIILDKVFWHYYFQIVRVISINWSHTQCQTLDRDNMSTLLLAIISLKHVTAYTLDSYTAPQIIIFQLQFNYGKKLADITLMRCLCESRSAKPALNRRLSRIFFPAG